jgi:hypothetical protein
MLVYHGANGEQIMTYLSARKIPLRGSEICLETRDPKNCFVHGVDSPRKQSYVLSLDVTLPKDNTLYNVEHRNGNPNTLVVRQDVPIKILMMFVRAGRAGNFHNFTIAENEIRDYLQKKWKDINAGLAST